MPVAPAPRLRGRHASSKYSGTTRRLACALCRCKNSAQPRAFINFAKEHPRMLTKKALTERHQQPCRGGPIQSAENSRKQLEMTLPRQYRCDLRLKLAPRSNGKCLPVGKRRDNSHVIRKQAAQACHQRRKLLYLAFFRYPRAQSFRRREKEFFHADLRNSHDRYFCRRHVLVPDRSLRVTLPIKSPARRLEAL